MLVYTKTRSVSISKERWTQLPRDAQEIISAYVKYGNYFAGFYEDVKNILEGKQADQHED